MILTRSREFTVNMGNYESLKIGASVTIDTDIHKSLHSENPYTEAEALLTSALEDDLREAEALTNTRDSYILSWKKDSK